MALIRLAVPLLAAAALLSACGGGGSRSGNPGAASHCVPTQIFGCLSPQAFGREANSRAAAQREKPAFSLQWGLETIGADRAWAHLELAHDAGTAPGAGQTVGAIDSGIDTGHSAFSGKTVSERFLSGAADETGAEFSHGTAVASVMAGRWPSSALFLRNSAAPGVAWGADIAMFALPFETDRGSYYRTAPDSLDDDGFKSVFDSVTEWRENGRTIDFVNLSFSIPGTIDVYSAQQLRTHFGSAIAAIAQASRTRKTVFVWSAGNDHGGACDRSLSTSYPTLCEPYVENGETKFRINAKSVSFLAGLPARIPELRGHVLAVVAVGRDGRIAPFSNRCGIAAQWCLAAPGVEVRVAYFGPDNAGTPAARGIATAQGTSFAAPMVTGGLAVMKHVFRNQLSNTALVSRMLATADRTGIYANSATYGRGLLDLGAATRPVGTNSFALGNSVGGRGSPVTHSRVALSSAFGDGLTAAFAGREIAAFDELGAPFWYRLGSFVRTAERPSAMTQLDAFMARHRESRDLRAVRRPAWPALLGTFVPAPGSDRGGGIRLGYLDAPAPGLGGGLLSLAGHALALDAAGPAGLGFTVFSTEGMRGLAPVSGALLSWQQAADEPGPAAGPPLNLVAGWIGERETMLGSRSAGAFGRLSAGSVFLGFDGSMQAGAWRVDAAAEFGMAYAGAGGGMLTGVSPLASSAFSLRADRPLDANSSLQLSVSQPLRIETGRARFSIPVGRTRDRRVLRRSLTANLGPGGRQIDLAARWRKRLDTGGDLRLGAIWTLDPGHDATAAPELTILAGLRHSF